MAKKNIYNLKLETIDDLRPLVTNQTNKNLPLYGWYNYTHSFSRDLVFCLLNDFGVGRSKKSRQSGIVLDPFCGAGTTLLAAKEYGTSALGIDIMPFSVFMSKAKTGDYDFNELRDAYKKLKTFIVNAEIKDIDELKRKNLSKYFDAEILDLLLRIMAWIKTQNEKVQQVFLVALFAILEKTSKMQKDGGFLRYTERDINIAWVKELFLKTVAKMLADVNKWHTEISSEKISIKIGDARETGLPDNHVSAIITSPPYPNRHDYTRTYYLELALGFYNTNDEIKKLRYETLRSHVEARPLQISKGYIPPVALTRLLEEISRERMPNDAIIPMLSGYFEDMYMVFSELLRVLKPRGYFALVVCNVRYSGVVVPVVDFLIEIAENVGLRFTKKIVARYKNNSAQQMQYYGTSPLEESIIIWQK